MTPARTVQQRILRRPAEHILEWGTAGACGIEAAAIIGELFDVPGLRRVPKLSHVCSARRWVAPLLVFGLAGHLWQAIRRVG